MIQVHRPPVRNPMSARTLPKALVAISLVSGAVIGTATATADNLPGTTGNTASNLPGTTGNTTAPAPAPAAQAPTQVTYTPVEQTAAVPQPVSQVVPQVSQAAQPLQREPEVVYVQGEPIVITETEYVDREIVQESGGLYLLTDKGRQWVTADKVFDAAAENYQQRDQADKDRLNITAAAAALGGTGGALIGAGTGLIVGGAAAGGAAFATAALPVTITASVPVLGQVTATGAAAAAIAAGLAGAGAGAVAGAGAGAGLGAAGAIAATGGTQDAQEYVADTVFTLENGAREDAGYNGLVGDKPSGLPGYHEPDAGSATRITEGTLLGDGGARGQADDANPANPATDATAPTDAPAAPVADPAPVLPQPFQAVNDAIDANQAFSAGVIDGAQQAMSNVVTGQASLPNLAELPSLAGI